MNWCTLVVNTLIIGNLVLQHNQMLRLHRYQDLDSRGVHKLFQSFFYVCFFFAATSLDLHHFKLPTVTPDVITENMVSSVVLIVISTLFIISMHTTQPLDQTPGENAYFTADLERQLLLSTDTFKSQPIVTVVSTPLRKTTTTHNSADSKANTALRSKDISPIQSFGNSNPREMEQTSPGTSHGRKFSAVKAPILATLLSSDAVIAMSTADDTQPLSHWTTALPALIALFYVASQVVYTTSIFKTNVYTPYRYLIMGGIWSVLLGTFTLVCTALDEFDISTLLLFPGLNWVNYVVGSALLIHGTVTVAVHVMQTRKKPTYLPGRINSVQIYNSIGSPSLHSIY